MNKTHYTFSHNYTDVTPIHISKACQTLRFEIMNASSDSKLITPIFVAKCVSLLDVVNNYLKLNFLESITESKILNPELITEFTSDGNIPVENTFEFVIEKMRQQINFLFNRHFEVIENLSFIGDWNIYVSKQEGLMPLYNHDVKQCIEFINMTNFFQIEINGLSPEYVNLTE